MKNVVIVTAKGGNLSVTNKNVVPILGVPVVLYPIRAAKLSLKTEAVFVSTEDSLIASVASKEGARIIDRPASLATPQSQHSEVIEHAVHQVESEYPDLENVIVLLGNTVMIPPNLIDHGFRILESGEADSCMSVWKAQDDHPYRAMCMNAQGFAESFLGRECGSNRQSYPEVYFYDQGIWGFKKCCAYERKGPKPWVWLGTRCRMIERLWVTGRDIHSWIDLSASSWYLTALQANDYQSFKDL